MEFKERGNEFFKNGKYKEAIKQYQLGLLDANLDPSLKVVIEQNLALSLRRVGSLQDAIDVCEKIDPSLRTAKVDHCNAACLFELAKYRQALDVMRKSKHPVDVLLEREIRGARIVAARNDDLLHDMGRLTSVNIMSKEAQRSFERCILEAADRCQDVLKTKNEQKMVMHWLGARDEVNSSVELLTKRISKDIDIYCVGPDIHADDMKDVVTKCGRNTVRSFCRKQLYNSELNLPKPDLLCAFCPGFDFGFDNWSSGIVAAIAQAVPIVVSGYSHDQSMVQNVDILVEFGAKVLVSSFFTSCGFSGFNHMVKNSHCCVVVGDASAKSSPKEIKQRLKNRGFEIP
jgi:tetratricopeptide (TPR) repeat protein